MIFRFSARSRWVSWCILVALSMAAVSLFGRRSFIASNKLDGSKPPTTDIEEDELTPSLINAHELLPVVSSNDSPQRLVVPKDWNPLPKWRDGNNLSRNEHLGHSPVAAPVLSPIPEQFPLQPRTKGQPPPVGDALVNRLFPPGQIQSMDQRSTPPISPFAAKPVLPNPNRDFAQGSLAAPQITYGKAQSTWPDRSYSPKSDPPSLFPDQQELTTPHVLTGSIVRQQVVPNKLPNENPSPFMHSQRVPSSPTSNYILQPLRKNP
ncbi:MAG: hypothetical protein SGI77_14500 [Pirellulaceae bacterium]|nr:hypothetical protein [Pirellulaceae bacterium]